jgi:putative GTP pyrophosphokinase
MVSAMDPLINWDEFLSPYKQTVDELVVKFDSVANEYRRQGIHSPIEQVSGRVKRIGSILEKANRKNVPYDEISEQIEDIAGIRIICKFAEDIGKVIEILKMRDGFDLKIMEERDYINKSKESGYQSYHVLIKYTLMATAGLKEVWAEIQIRTLAMNFWATIEHSLKYKYNGKIPENVRVRLKDSAAAASKLDREMSKIRNEITEAQDVILAKNDLVDEIQKKIHNLYFVAKLEKVNELNREFIDIYMDFDLGRLRKLNEKLKVIAQIYNVEYL